MMNETNTELYEKLSRLHRLMHKQNMRGHMEYGPMADPTRGQGRILAILKMQDGVSTKDLSYLLGIRVSSLNELLAKMEKSGYITREASEADKRIMLVNLTEKGRAEPQQARDPGDILACLTPEEQTALGEYLDRIIAALEADIGDAADDDERSWWMGAARARMGDDRFERFASMRRGGFPGGPGFGPRGGFPGGPGFDPRGGFGGCRHGDGHGSHRDPHDPHDEGDE